MKRGEGARLTKPGWSKPHTHSNPTNLALFRHKITLYRFNQGAHTIAGRLKWEQGAEPPNPLTLTNTTSLAAVTTPCLKKVGHFCFPNNFDNSEPIFRSFLNLIVKNNIVDPLLPQLS